MHESFCWRRFLLSQIHSLYYFLVLFCRLDSFFLSTVTAGDGVICATRWTSSYTCRTSAKWQDTNLLCGRPAAFVGCWIVNPLHPVSWSWCVIFFYMCKIRGRRSFRTFVGSSITLGLLYMLEYVPGEEKKHRVKIRSTGTISTGHRYSNTVCVSPTYLHLSLAIKYCTQCN